MKWELDLKRKESEVFRIVESKLQGFDPSLMGALNGRRFRVRLKKGFFSPYRFQNMAILTGEITSHEEETRVVLTTG